jgi:hypothetical protein
MLVDDHDAEIRSTAAATIEKIPEGVISSFIARSEVPTELREFFAARGIEPAATPSADSEEALIDADTTDYGPEPETEDEKRSVVQQLAAMSVPERVKAAIKGSREMRSILIRDPNKLVALAVLSSPKMTEMEIEAIARMGSVSEDVLRTIAQARNWTKSYAVVLALVKNAKTPLAFSMHLLNRLTEKDLKQLSTNRNVPETLRIAARRKLAAV